MTRSVPARLPATALALALAACSSTHQAAYVAPDWRAPATVTLMPVLDARWAKSVEIDLAAQILQPLQQQLAAKGYRVELAGQAPDALALDACESPTAEIDLMLAAAPSAQDSVLAVVLEDACASFGGFTTTLGVHVYGAWIDVGGRRHLWRDRVAMAQGAGGFLAANLLSFDDLLAQAVGALGEGLPARDRGTAPAAGGAAR